MVRKECGRGETSVAAARCSFTVDGQRRVGSLRRRFRFDLNDRDGTRQYGADDRGWCTPDHQRRPFGGPFCSRQGKGTGAGSKSGDRGEQANGTEIQSATVEGNVVLVQAPAEKQGAAAESPMRATAGRAVYEQTENGCTLREPRVEDGGLQLVADKLDVPVLGDAFAHET